MCRVTRRSLGSGILRYDPSAPRPSFQRQVDELMGAGISRRCLALTACGRRQIFGVCLFPMQEDVSHEPLALEACEEISLLVQG